MKVGILCEFSGAVRDEFLDAGHDAVSCDLLPTESYGPHIKGDCLTQDWRGFDLLICHPPCTYLAVSGAPFFKNPERMRLQGEALDFVRALMKLPCPRIAIENPVSVISSKIRKPDQMIHPWQFGHEDEKRTCLWLKNLPPLIPTKVIKPGRTRRWENQGRMLPPSPDRWKQRSLTFWGIARAMAEQWGTLPKYSPLYCVD